MLVYATGGVAFAKLTQYAGDKDGGVVWSAFEWPINDAGDAEASVGAGGAAPEAQEAPSAPDEQE